jgi:hypothetical protein
MNRPIRLFASINMVQGVSAAIIKRPRGLRLSKPAILHREPKQTNEEKLVDVTVGAHDILLTATTVFPFVLFPDTISMDRQQLTIVHRSFFSTANTISVRIEDVLNIESNVGPFFGSIHIFSKFFTNDIKSINFLSRVDTLTIQRLVQGYMIAHHRKIDCSTIEKSLGQGATTK